MLRDCPDPILSYARQQLAARTRLARDSWWSKLTNFGIASIEPPVETADVRVYSGSVPEKLECAGVLLSWCFVRKDHLRIVEEDLPVEREYAADERGTAIRTLVLNAGCTNDHSVVVCEVIEIDGYRERFIARFRGHQLVPDAGTVVADRIHRRWSDLCIPRLWAPRR